MYCFVFKGKLKPLKTKSPTLTSPVQLLSQKSLCLPQMCWSRDQISAPGGGGVILEALKPPKFGQKWDISGTGGGNKADGVYKGAGIQALPTKPFNWEGRREGGSGSSLFSGTPSPRATFPILQMPFSLPGPKREPLPSPILPREPELPRK